jgi:hypothetical protein
MCRANDEMYRANDEMYRVDEEMYRVDEEMYRVDGEMYDANELPEALKVKILKIGKRVPEEEMKKLLIELCDYIRLVYMKCQSCCIETWFSSAIII